MIYELTDEAGIQVHDQQGFDQLVVCYFQSLLAAFTSPHDMDVSRSIHLTSLMPCCLS
jgi:hypothetical protein